MGEIKVPDTGQKGGQLVPRCNLRHVSNPEAEYGEWKYRRCIRENFHRGRCAIVVGGNTIQK